MFAALSHTFLKKAELCLKKKKTSLCLIDLVFRARGTYICFMSRQKERVRAGDTETESLARRTKPAAKGHRELRKTKSCQFPHQLQLISSPRETGLPQSSEMALLELWSRGISPDLFSAWRTDGCLLFGDYIFSAQRHPEVQEQPIVVRNTRAVYSSVGVDC